MEEAAICSRPKFTAAVFEDHADELVGEPVVRAIGAKAAAAVMKQSAAVGCNPQRSVASNFKGANVLVGHGRRVEARVDHKTHAIEARQSAGSSHPEVAI